MTTYVILEKQSVTEFYGLAAQVFYTSKNKAIRAAKHLAKDYLTSYQNRIFEPSTPKFKISVSDDTCPRVDVISIETIDNETFSRVIKSFLVQPLAKDVNFH